MSEVHRAWYVFKNILKLLCASYLDGIKTAVLPGKFQQRHQCLQ